MDDPPSFVVTPIAAPLSAQFTKLTFRGLYIRRTGPVSREIIMDGKSDLGKRYISDFPVHDGTGSDAKLVARVQGLSLQAGNMHQVFTMVFETERFKGSTLLINGVISLGSDEWAIYGGTGLFRMASGVIRRKYLAERIGGNSDELTMDVYCPAFVLSSQKPKEETSSVIVSPQQPKEGSVTKVGLWGGQGGSQQDITEPPQRLQSLTIRSGNAIDSIQFIYTDKAGQKHTAGPWGGSGGTAQTIDLWDTEYIKEVSGTIGKYGNNNMTFLSSFSLVTTSRTLGPWGIKDGTSFSITAPANSSIVGFYARSGSLVDAIGVYLREL